MMVNRSAQRNICSNIAMSTTSPTQLPLGLNPGHHGKKLVNNNLTFGMIKTTACSVTMFLLLPNNTPVFYATPWHNNPCDTLLPYNTFQCATALHGPNIPCGFQMETVLLPWILNVLLTSTSPLQLKMKSTTIHLLTTKFSPLSCQVTSLKFKNAL